MSKVNDVIREMIENPAEDSYNPVRVIDTDDKTINISIYYT